MEAVTVDHQFVAYANPVRHPNTCVRCSRPRDAHPAPPPSGTVPRHVSREGRIVSDASEPGRNEATTALWQFACERAHPGGVRVDRDLDREALEELADCLNYVVWRVAYTDLDPTLVPSRLGAIRLLAELFELLR